VKNPDLENQALVYPLSFWRGSPRRSLQSMLGLRRLCLYKGSWFPVYGKKIQKQKGRKIILCTVYLIPLTYGLEKMGITGASSL
jgi:hypothetical protein